MPRRRPPRREPQQPPDHPDVVEVFDDSCGETQQRNGEGDVVEVFYADPEVAFVAASQEGTVSRAQLRARGLTDRQIDHRIARSRLHRVHRATYLVGHEVPPERAPHFAAVIALGDNAYLTHGSALEDYGVLEPGDGPVHVTVVGCCRRSRDGIRVHRTTRIAPEDLGTRDGLRITSLARAVLDYAEYASAGELGRAINNALIKRLVTDEDLRAVIARTPGRRGAALVTATLNRHDGPAKFRSGGEAVVLALLKCARLGRPDVNAKAEGVEIDFLYRTPKVAIELDGGRPHGTPDAVDRDRRKDALLRSRGYVVLRYSWWQIEEETEAVIAEISATLASRGGAEQRP